MTTIFDSTLVRNLAIMTVVGIVAVVYTGQVDDFSNFHLAELGAYICAAAGLTILIGGNGQVSLGHAALMAVGAYTVAKYVADRGDDFGMLTIGTVVTALVLAVVVTTIVGAVIGVAAARLRGPYLAGATLALGVALPGVTTYFHDTFNGEQGLAVGTPVVPVSMEANVTLFRWSAMISLICAVVVLFLLANLKRSAVGRHLAAVRDHEISAQLCGLSVPREQIRAFAISAATAGLGGGVLGFVLQLANPASFGLVLSLALLGAVVIGGLGSLRGAVWGSVVVVYLAKYLEDIEVDPNMPAAVYGLLLIVVMLVFPAGIQGLLNRLEAMLPRRTAQLTGGH